MNSSSQVAEQEKDTTKLGTIVFLEILIFFIAAFLIVSHAEKSLLFLIISHAIFLPIAGRYLK